MKNSVTESLISTLKRSKTSKTNTREIDFLRIYYHRLSGQDFVDSDAKLFQSRAVKHRSIATHRRKGEVIIQAVNYITDKEKNVTDKTIIYIVQDDQPFIVNSLLMKLNELKKSPDQVLHPVFSVKRNKSNKALSYSRYQNLDETADKDTIAESYIQFVIGWVSEEQHKPLILALKKVIGDIAVVVKDWQPMTNQVVKHSEIVDSFSKGPVFAEYGNLLRWMANNHFAFLGYCELSIKETAKGKITQLHESTALGLIRSELKSGSDIVRKILPPIIFTGNAPVVFTKSRSKATIHRPNYMDCILFDHDFENIKGCRSKNKKISCFLGFQARSTSTIPTSNIPHIGNKIAYILKSSTLRKSGYAYKELRNILETLPRDKLFHMEVKRLYALSMTLLNQERRKARLHLHKNICGHFYSCLVYVPKDLFNSQLRQKIMDYLSLQLNANAIEFEVYFSDSILTRIHFIIQTNAELTNESSEKLINTKLLENTIQKIARDWNDNLYQRLLTKTSPELAEDLAQRFYDSFPVIYQQDYSIANAVIDLDLFIQLKTQSIIAVLGIGNRTGKNIKSSQYASFKLYSKGKAIALFDVLPILENMGVKVLGGRPYKIKPVDGDTYRILDFNIVRQDGKLFDFEQNAALFQSTFIHSWNGNCENDGFNQLTLLAQLDWRQIGMLRAYYRYLKQIRLLYSESYIIEALINNPELVTTIISLFYIRFNPNTHDDGIRKANRKIRKQLEDVSTLDEERIISALFDTISSTLRTNYFQVDADGSPKPYLSLKLDSKSITRIPEPAPQFEIFVYSPRVEGVHLRGGLIARGGLRWSERPEDFRTEVLGLVKAQRVKNAVIVPVGSKGGFVAKQLPNGQREEILAEVIACYKIFISALLDITDNISGSKIYPPKDVVRIDGDDPYLVVAADKGTATFSDIANEISENYGFWLGDAFASGGSAGYDHKKMGITARGAWESVKRHFRELGKDIQNQAFTVAGIGDMAGDVFGNGMLLSQHTKLIAAFNHLHIFIDPDPNPKDSYAERKRLFELPGSSWTDYNDKLISRGGGIYSRNAKSIKLSPQAKKALNAKQDSYSPTDLINVILKAEVELLWNGGIGTYVKASSETHDDAQDRNNDALRVDATELRCQVIGEGGNLGITQLARIEFSGRGGLCYTDAIDNSAGVDTSDHEVNIKILLNAEVQKNRLTLPARNKLLASMEKEVGQLVLDNNYLQTQILSLETTRSPQLMFGQSRAISLLEQQNLLHREIEFLADEQTLNNRFSKRQYLTRPELAVLLSYSKMDLYQKLLDSNVPDDDYLTNALLTYFPKALVKKIPEKIRHHRLKREIISTQVTNNLIGIMGVTFHIQMFDIYNINAADLTRAYMIIREIVQSDVLIKHIQSLDNKIKAKTQMYCQIKIAQALESSILWLAINHTDDLDINKEIKRFGKGFHKLIQYPEKTFSNNQKGAYHLELEKLTKNDIPTSIAKKISALSAMADGLEIINTAIICNKDPIYVAQVHFATQSELQLDWVKNKIEKLKVENIWHERSISILRNNLKKSHSSICYHILSIRSKKSAEEIVERWVEKHKKDISNFKKMIKNLRKKSDIDMPMLSVILNELNRLV